jgi:predicted nucleic acid-binding protein
MVLVDTSVWVSHFRKAHDGLVELLTHGEVACHPFIIGELACGTFRNRTNILLLLEALPMAFPAEHAEVLAFVETHNLMGKGLGYIDVHLLAAALLNRLSLWTLDKKLEKASDALQCKYKQR